MAREQRRLSPAELDAAMAAPAREEPVLEIADPSKPRRWRCQFVDLPPFMVGTVIKHPTFEVEALTQDDATKAFFAANGIADTVLQYEVAAIGEEHAAEKGQ